MRAAPPPDGLEVRLADVRRRVAAAARAAGRDPAAITMLAVTKGHPAAACASALDAGIGDLGESRVQEAQAKRRSLDGRAATWHMVGHVQRNKARAAAALFDVVHSVDSAALAALLHRHRAAEMPPLHVFVEVELTGIPGRGGVVATDVPELVAAVAALPRLALQGLMTVAPPGPDARARACFARLRRLRDDAATETGLALPHLSMGMSDDFEVAIAEGATVLRLGRALFGAPAGTDPPPPPAILTSHE